MKKDCRYIDYLITKDNDILPLTETQFNLYIYLKNKDFVSLEDLAWYVLRQEDTKQSKRIMRTQIHNFNSKMKRNNGNRTI